MQKYVVGLVALLSPFVMANAGEDNVCQSSFIAMPASTPTAQFDPVESTISLQDELIVDNKTGLMWLRCTYGFEWDGANFTCTDNQGSAVTWKGALDEVASANIGNLHSYSDWRLPNIKELASLVERKCTSLTINKNVFPGTGAVPYWSNTHRLGTTDIRVVNFNTGVVADSVPFSDSLYFRLVRDNQ